MEYDPIIVVGPGRSGTSAVAGVLYQLGVFMGERLHEADESNSSGYFEDRDFIEVNHQLATRAIKHEQWKARVSDLLRERRARLTAWGWKDPRTCDFLPHYLELVGEAKFIRCVRKATDVEASALKAYGRLGWWTPWFDRLGLKWLQRTLVGRSVRTLRKTRENALDRYLTGRSVLIVDFDDLMRNRESVVRNLAKFCGIVDLPEHKLRNALEFIRPKDEMIQMQENG